MAPFKNFQNFVGANFSFSLEQRNSLFQIIFLFQKQILISFKLLILKNGERN